MISKELMSRVLQENVKEVCKIGSNPNFKDNTLLFSLNGCGELCDINIHELAFETRDYLRDKGYEINMSKEIKEIFEECEKTYKYIINEGQS